MSKYSSLCLTLWAVATLAILSSCSGEQSSPENVGRAYIEARTAGDWVKINGLRPVDKRSEDASNRCSQGGINWDWEFHANIEGTKIEGNCVTFIGNFWERCTTYFENGSEREDVWTATRFGVCTEKISGKYYITQAAPLYPDIHPPVLRDSPTATPIPPSPATIQARATKTAEAQQAIQQATSAKAAQQTAIATLQVPIAKILQKVTVEQITDISWRKIRRGGKDFYDAVTLDIVIRNNDSQPYRVQYFVMVCVEIEVGGYPKGDIPHHLAATVTPPACNYAQHSFWLDLQPNSEVEKKVSARLIRSVPVERFGTSPPPVPTIDDVEIIAVGAQGWPATP